MRGTERTCPCNLFSPEICFFSESTPLREYTSVAGDLVSPFGFTQEYLDVMFWESTFLSFSVWSSATSRVSCPLVLSLLGLSVLGTLHCGSPGLCLCVLFSQNIAVCCPNLLSVLWPHSCDSSNPSDVSLDHLVCIFWVSYDYVPKYLCMNFAFFIVSDIRFMWFWYRPAA